MSWTPGGPGFDYHLPFHGHDLPHEPWTGNDDSQFLRGLTVERYSGKTTSSDQGERPQ